MSMWQAISSAMMRRKRWTILLILIALLETGAAMVLCMLAARQESALEKTIDTTLIPCVVTDAYGLNQDNLHMATGFVDLLCGLRHERGYYQDEYVENVRAKASIKLINPKGYTMVCLLTPDSDYTLTAAGGGSITLFDGWDASVFSGDSKVCVIPWQLAGDGEYIEIDNGNFSVNLRVIGTHTGPANNIYCPFHAMDFHDGQSYMVTADACSFDIKDARRLDEAKAALYEVFADLSTADQSGIRPAFAVRINDDILRNTLEEIRGNIRTLHLLVPVLLFIEGAVSFFAAYLSTQSRLREYAVMRCLGMTRGRIFRLTFCEYFTLAIVGAAFGTVTGIAITGTLSPQMLLYGAGAVSAFMIGTSMSISRITRINVMMLMKTEE